MFPWSLFPFNKDMKDQMNKMNPKEIDSYVQDMMKKMFPGGYSSMMNPTEAMNGHQPFIHSMNKDPVQQEQEKTAQHNQIPVNVFETFEDVYIRMKIPNEEWMKQMKIFHTSNQAIIENIPEHGDRQVLTLPSLVKKKGAMAQYRDGILELRIPRSVDLQYTEIDVSDKY
ncbi:Hsp20/alpha crystallin family protein [Rossellomorea aquimaris]|uniref:Hsp20/alpha crystallin family protein n=1 Tax=Rossellomorea aquimaris TaxID=189382 RepID=UPI001CD36422|nr:Hsp20/alpha crystallin family protein [Rossellomorea aquimaris]MCA1053964.1 Hsp20/alpha crystallin family protein [Rossellomorea aquimaris]